MSSQVRFLFFWLIFLFAKASTVDLLSAMAALRPLDIEAKYIDSTDKSHLVSGEGTLDFLILTAPYCSRKARLNNFNPKPPTPCSYPRFGLGTFFGSMLVPKVATGWSPLWFNRLRFLKPKPSPREYRLEVKP